MLENIQKEFWRVFAHTFSAALVALPCELARSTYTTVPILPFQSIRQSRVTGLPKSTKCHVCHGHFGEVTKSFCDHVPNIENFRRLRRQTGENFVHVTANFGGWRNHIFVRCVTRHSAWRIDWNGTVVWFDVNFVYCFGTIFGDCRLNLQSGGDYKQTNHDRSVKAAVRRQS